MDRTTLGHYEIVGTLGTGAMGEVYLARDTRLCRRVALKVLPQEVAADPERRARFEREARAVAALSHPNIVTVYSVEETGGVHFITMELVDGATLTRMLPKRGFALNEFLRIAIQLANAVSCAHRAGIIYRDLKPDNIMIDGDGRLRVLDFGISKMHDAPNSEETLAATANVDTEEGRLLGTVAYMSPEQAEGRTVDVRSDVFSVGTILYEMATGKRPFAGDTSMSTIGSILRDDPFPVTDLEPSLPSDLGRILRRCLAKSPDRRYQTALDLRNELEALRDEIGDGNSTSVVEARTLHPGRLRRPLPVLIASMVGVLACVAVVTTVALRREADSQQSVLVSRPITSAISQEADINWSPESEFIAFSQIRAGSLDVMVQPVAGGVAEVRASGPGTEACPRWSPHGKYMAYISSSEPGSPVFLVPPHGGTPRKLISTNLRALVVDKLQSAMGDRPWSRDGRKLLVARADASGQTAIYRVDRDNGTVEQLTFPRPGAVDLYPSYSFDGERIVFQRRTNGKGALLIIPATGGEPEVLLADDFDDIGPTWRPDNRHILFLSNRGESSGGADIWEIDLVDGSLRQLTFETNRVVSVSVSADDRVAYAPFWHDTFLFAVDVETGDTRQLTSHTQDNFGARFSPDGRAVAYHSTRTGDSEIWIHYLDDRPETRITDNDAWDLYPDWSPDGRQLIFVSDREGNRFKLFIANRNGGGERVLLDRAIYLDSQISPVIGSLVSRWSPDGEQIAFLVEGEALWSMRSDGTDVRRVLDGVTGFDWYQDSRHGIYTRHHGSGSEMIAVNLETGQERSLFVGSFIEMDVAPDGSAVAFCLGLGHMAMGLAVLELTPPSERDGLPRAHGKPRYVVRTRGTWHVHNGGWSADSRRLVYTQDKDYGDIYELVERF